MRDNWITPDFVFESSWEVCNKVGGIYTVLSTRAKTLQEALHDNLVFIGPDFWQDKENPLFDEKPSLWPEWTAKAKEEGLSVRVGRWTIPGNPYVILIDFKPFLAQRNEIYGAAWNDFQVNSLHGYGDYDDGSMFAYAAGRVVESFWRCYLQQKANVVFQAHEWMSCLGALYIQRHVPQIATIFTTHATSIGRSIAGNNKPLYEYLWAYNGTQMSQELNIEAKHSIERQTALNVDCFTTVSDVTGRECKELLDKECDAILMNGFESDFVPTGAQFTAKRRAARKRIFQIANALTGKYYPEDTLIVTTSGRYEFKNKGIDVFVNAMHCVGSYNTLHRPLLAIVQVPAWVASPRQDLMDRVWANQKFTTPLDLPIITHNLHNLQDDSVTNMLRGFNMYNRPEDNVHVIFVPCYLDGNDGIFNVPYYDLLIGDDLAVYPSYYEPWGYTPLEAVAFHVPCITTSLSGFGMWADKVKGDKSHIEDGVEVINRNDYNYDEVTEAICQTIIRFADMDKKGTDASRRHAAQLAEKALWKHFIQYYYQAYDFALHKMQVRMSAIYSV